MCRIVFISYTQRKTARGSYLILYRLLRPESDTLILSVENTIKLGQNTVNTQVSGGSPVIVNKDVDELGIRTVSPVARL